MFVRLLLHFLDERPALLLGRPARAEFGGGESADIHHLDKCNHRGQGNWGPAGIGAGRRGVCVAAPFDLLILVVHFGDDGAAAPVLARPPPPGGGAAVGDAAEAGPAVGMAPQPTPRRPAPLLVKGPGLLRPNALQPVADC